MLSIIIPTFNEERYLPLLLRSIKRQTYRDYEVIVADARSRDRTQEIVKNFSAKVVGGGMPGSGRNAGAKAARGSIFLFLDADVVLEDRDFLHQCLAEFHRRKLDVATCAISPMSEKVVDRVFHGIFNVYMRAVVPILPHAPGFCILAKRGMHEKINGFDETVVFAEDKDYVNRASKVGAKFRILNAKKIAVSVRRFDRDGRWNIAKRYLLAELHHAFRGSVRKELFSYEFGKYDDLGRKPPLAERRRFIKERLARTFGGRRLYGGGEGQRRTLLPVLILKNKARDLWRKLK